MKEPQRALHLYGLVGSMVGAGIGLVIGAVAAAGTSDVIAAGLSHALLLGLLGLAVDRFFSSDRHDPGV